MLQRSQDRGSTSGQGTALLEPFLLFDIFQQQGHYGIFDHRLVSRPGVAGLQIGRLRHSIFKKDYYLTILPGLVRYEELEKQTDGRG